MSYYHFNKKKVLQKKENYSREKAAQYIRKTKKQ